ncbi:MAG TPA: hypothetical protein VGJ86_07880 [Acidimicrobiales bacterium]
MAMVLPWTRRRLLLQTQRETEEQLVSVGDQLLEVGAIVGRLDAVASRFEETTARLMERLDQEENDEHGDGTTASGTR